MGLLFNCLQEGGPPTVIITAPTPPPSPRHPHIPFSSDWRGKRGLRRPLALAPTAPGACTNHSDAVFSGWSRLWRPSLGMNRMGGREGKMEDSTKRHRDRAPHTHRAFDAAVGDLCLDAKINTVPLRKPYCTP